MQRSVQVLFALLAGLCSSISTARPVQNWSDKDLTDHADLVVVAAPASSQDEPADRSNAKSDSWVGVNTKFQVAAVLKGELKEGEVTLLHHRYFGGDKTAVEIIDGPGFVKFDPAAGQKYMLYLKRLEDGRFEPVSGQYDPHFSVKVIKDYADPTVRPVNKP